MKDIDKLKDKIIIRIERLKDTVERETGSFKYSDCYDDCIEIVKHTSLNDKHLI